MGDSKVECECLVCAFRRVLAERYPNGHTAETLLEVIEGMGAALAAPVRLAGPESLVLFFAAFNRAMASFEAASASSGETLQ